MEIYLKVESENEDTNWYVDEKDCGCGSYLARGKELEATNDCGYEYVRGSAANSWKEMRSWVKTARMLANWNGFGKIKLTFWKWQRGKLVQVKAPKIAKHKAA